MQERLIVGPAKFMRGGTVRFGRYGNGVIAIQIIAPDGSPEATASVNMAMEPNDIKTEVWIKDCEANEGVADALVKAGVIELTGEIQYGGHGVAAKAARLTPAALAQFEAEAL